MDILILKWMERLNIRINRIHLEEDAGKNTHATDGFSYVDLNRQGTPLIEIVVKQICAPLQEAYAYLEALREVICLLEYLTRTYGRRIIAL